MLPDGLNDRMPVVSETVIGPNFKRAVVSRRYKLICDVQNGGKLLFDLQEDPFERNNIYDKQPDAAAEMETLYQRWLDSPGNR